jgi:hypothetical protein
MNLKKNDESPLETTYKNQIRGLINRLTESNDPERKTILKEIKQIDRLYFEKNGMTIHGQVLLSRHGESKKWGQKKLGLSPNSPISEAAEKNLAKTNQLTHDLLLHDNELRCAVSPLVRPLQTAALIIPAGIKARISIHLALSENSNTPSGLDIRSNDDLNNISKNTRFFSIKRFLFFLSKLIYGLKHFNFLNQKRSMAAKVIESHNKPEHSIFKNGEISQALDYKENKISAIEKLINDTTEKDLWLIGHGTNFKTFFSKKFGIKSSFKYCETRRIYKVQGNGSDPILVTPPYTMFINQRTGKIDSTYTGVTAKEINTDSPRSSI